jgi:hypothetical protein
MLSQGSDIVPHQAEFVGTQMVQVIPCKDPCLVQIIEEYPADKPQLVKNESCRLSKKRRMSLLHKHEIIYFQLVEVSQLTPFSKQHEKHMPWNMILTGFRSSLLIQLTLFQHAVSRI